MAWKDVNPNTGAKLREARKQESTLVYEAEERARKSVENEVKGIRNMIDSLVREMADRGSTLAEIKRYYGTKDHNTIKAILDRTVSLSEVTPVNDKYSYNDDTKILSVNYTSHGARELTGAITIGVWDDKNGGLMFLPLDGVTTPLYDDQNEVNQIVNLLTPLTDMNEYKKEALVYLATQTVTLGKPKMTQAELDYSLDTKDDKWEDSGNDLRKFLSEAEDELGGFE